MGVGVFLASSQGRFILTTLPRLAKPATELRISLPSAACSSGTPLALSC